MGKIKSAICLAAITLIIAVLSVVCFVSFPVGSIHYYNSILSLASKDSGLGGYLVDGTTYLGGGYAAIYYPEGVISAKEYEGNVADKSDDAAALKEYTDKYVPYANGAVYLEKEVVCEENSEQISDAFKEEFARHVDVIKERYESLHAEGTSIEICDDYTVRVFLPATIEASLAAFQFFSYTGGFSLQYGTSEDAATTVLPSQKGIAHTADYYIKGASSRTNAGTSYVIVNFTKEGRKLLADTTAEASSDYLYFYVGDNHILSLTVNEQIDQDALYISGSYTDETASMVASLINSAVKQGVENDGEFTMSEIYRVPAQLGENTLLYFYIVYGACAVAMIAFFLIRYRRLGFAHIYTFLIYLIAMTLSFWALGGLHIGAGTLLAVILTSVLLCVCDAISFEYVRREYATGKTMTFSVKTGYKKCMWHIFDLHIVLMILGLLLGLIGLTEISLFGYALLLGGTISGLCALIVNRFLWFIMMPFAKNAGEFCHFKREEVESND